jgi:hypothetical protein
MALSFPLSVAQFMSLLPVAEITFDIPESRTIDETGGGEVLTSSYGTRLWQGEVALGDMEPPEADIALPLLDVLRRDGASFMAYDVSRPAPTLDPGGIWLTTTGGAPKLHTVDANGRDLRISGLPAWYRLQPRDYLAWSYGSSPTRFALHRVVTAAVADATGLTPLFEVSPSIRPGWVVNSDVQLVRPACKALIVPGSVQIGRRSAALVKGAGFKFIQTLR